MEVWRLADGKLVERWGSVDPAVLLPLGEVPVSIEALGAGHRRVTVTQMTVEPGAAMAVDNGQAIRVFAIDAGTLTFDVGSRSGATVTVARESATPIASGPGRAIAAATGDIVVTSPEADYTLTNEHRLPLVALVVIVSNTLGGEWPLNSAAAAASWTVVAMPQALGGALPSPAGFSARILTMGVELELPAESMLALGWMFLAPEATLVLPAGDGALLAIDVEGWVDLAVTDGTPGAKSGARGVGDGSGWCGESVAG